MNNNIDVVGPSIYTMNLRFVFFQLIEQDTHNTKEIISFY